MNTHPTLLDNWIGWLQVRIPVLKESQNVYWLKQAMEGYKSDSSKTEPTHAEMNTQPEEEDFSIEKASSNIGLMKIAQALFGGINSISEPVAPIDKTLSAEEYVSITHNHLLFHSHSDQIIECVNDYANLRVEQAKEETIEFLKKCIDSCNEQIEYFVNNGMGELTGGSAAMKCAYQIVLRQIQPGLFYGK